MSVEVDLEVDGRRHSASIGDGTVTVDGRVFHVRCRPQDDLLIVQVGDMVHVVDVGDPRKARIDGEPVAFRIHHLTGVVGAPRDAAGTHGPVRAPMSGRIESVAVAAGQEVGGGDVLFVLEAMKMRNEVKAPVAGRVAAVHVEAGSTVEATTVVLELAPLE